jgi:hypothetical protein
MGIPLRRGRFLSDHDTPDQPRVILVNEALARRYFPGEDAVGRATDRGTIAGVVGDVRTSRLDQPASPEIYYAFAQNTAATADAGVALVVRTTIAPETAAASVRAAILDVNPRQVVFGVKTMERVIADSVSDRKLYVWLIGGFAAMATGARGFGRLRGGFAGGGGSRPRVRHSCGTWGERSAGRPAGAWAWRIAGRRRPCVGRVRDHGRGSRRRCAGWLGRRRSFHAGRGRRRSGFGGAGCLRGTGPAGRAGGCYRGPQRRLIPGTSLRS